MKKRKKEKELTNLDLSSQNTDEATKKAMGEKEKWKDDENANGNWKERKKVEFSHSFNFSLGRGDHKTTILGWNLKVRSSPGSGSGGRRGSCRSEA